MAKKLNKSMQRFNCLTTEIESAYHEAAMKLGLSDSAMVILYTLISCNGECMLSDIISFSGISKQTVNSAVHKLEKEEAVYSESVGRRKKIYFSDLGEKLAKATVGQIIDIENDIFSSWSKDECEMYIKLTQKYLSDFTERTKELKVRK